MIDIKEIVNNAIVKAITFEVLNAGFNPKQLRKPNGQWTKTFEGLYKDSVKILSKYNFLNDIRTQISKTELEKKVNIGELSPYMMNLLNTKNNELNLTLESLLKNCLHHPEILKDDYLKINNLLKKPNKVSYSKKNNLNILVFNYKNKKYLMVIKTTKNREENYLTSFRLFSDNEYEKY